MNVVEFPWEKKGSFSDYNRTFWLDPKKRKGGPYTIAFCYPREGEPFIVKGGLLKVDAYLELLSAPGGLSPIFVHRTWYYYSFKATTYKVYGKPDHINITISHSNLYDKRSTIQILDYRANPITVKEWKVRRVPRKWIKEFDEFF